MVTSELLFRLEGMHKSFDITKALSDVKLELFKGQVLGLIGENGSGKSTLVSIIAAIQKSDAGKMFKNGRSYTPKTIVEANKMGVQIILQEQGTFDQLTVAKNIFIGREFMFSRHGFLDNKKMNAEAQKALDGINSPHIRADQPISNYNFEDRKLVELARAMSGDPDILIIDESTTALSRNGRNILYDIMKKMKAKQKGIIFISHDIEELLQRCDVVTVLRDGFYVDSVEKDDFEPNLLKRLMVGRDISDNYYRVDYERCEGEGIALEFDKVNTDVLDNIDFTLKKGEILGIGGLANCGIHDVGKLAFGLTALDSGSIKTGTGELINNPRKAMKKKIAYISKNRDQESLLVSSSIKDNICIASYDKLSKGLLITPAREKNFVSEWSDCLEIKMQNMNQYVFELSGGNKQKVALAKWLGFGADIFILDCPTRGIDIGVKTNIYKLMDELRKHGKSIIMVSEELPELIGMCDRILILKDGRISAEFNRSEDLTETKLIEYII